MEYGRYVAPLTFCVGEVHCTIIYTLYAHLHAHTARGAMTRSLCYATFYTPLHEYICQVHILRRILGPDRLFQLVYRHGIKLHTLCAREQDHVRQ